MIRANPCPVIYIRVARGRHASHSRATHTEPASGSLAVTCGIGEATGRSKGGISPSRSS